MNESIQLALTVSLIAIGFTLLIGVLGYLVEKNNGDDAKPRPHKPDGKGA
jgi:hypothetical protein